MKRLCAELQRTWHEQIPISKAMGVTVVDFANDQLVVRADLAPNINVHGTAFAGSLYAISSLCGWGMTWLQLKTRGLDASIVIADGKIHYERPVQEAIVATCAFSIRDQGDSFDRLRNEGKARLLLECITHTSGEPAVQFTGVYAMRMNRRD